MLRKSFLCVLRYKPNILCNHSEKFLQRSISYGERFSKLEYLTLLNPSFEKIFTAKFVFNKNTRYKHRQCQFIMLGGLLYLLGLEKKPEEEEHELITIIKRGILLIQKNEPEKAEQMLHLALKIAQEEQNHDGVTYVYDVMANLAFETGQHAKAEKLFISVLQRLIAGGYEPNDNKVVHISLKLAKIYEAMKDHPKAEKGFKYCLNHMEKKMETVQDEDEDTIGLWAMTLDWYARYLLSQRKTKEAMLYLKKAYNMCLKIYGKNHEQTAVLLNDLGTVSNMMGDTETAVNYLQEAASIGKKLPDMQDLASIYVNLGQLYLLKRMFEESQSACKEGLKKAEKMEDKETLVEAKNCLDQIQKLMLS